MDPQFVFSSEERPLIDRKSIFRNATRNAQARLVLEKTVQELRSNLAALNANNALLQQTLGHQDIITGLQRFYSICSQNMEVTESLRHLNSMLPENSSQKMAGLSLKELKTEMYSAIEEFQKVLLELNSGLKRLFYCKEDCGHDSFQCSCLDNTWEKPGQSSDETNDSVETGTPEFLTEVTVPGEGEDNVLESLPGSDFTNKTNIWRMLRIINANISQTHSFLRELQGSRWSFLHKFSMQLSEVGVSQPSIQSSI